MTGTEHSALVALLRAGVSARQLLATSALGSPDVLLDERLGLFGASARSSAQSEIEAWHRRGIELLSVFDAEYPAALRASSSPPPLLFIGGRLTREDERAVAVVGTRRPSERGAQAAGAIARMLVSEGFVVVSGLAEGIDTEAHLAALAAGGRTVAVIGSGLDHCFPRKNERLQQRLLRDAAVVSQFWPATTPSRRTFPLRNGTMAAMTLATVIAEAGATSGTRIQARRALECGRQVLLLRQVTQHAWARDLAQRPGVTVVDTPAEIQAALAAPATSGATS